jgi:phage RecT family recombinase
MTTPNNKPSIVQKDSFVPMLEAQKKQLELALPRNMKADIDRYKRIILTEFNKNPRLQQCNPRTIIAAVMQGAQLGLEFGPSLGQAFLVPYGSECTFQIGYRGLVALVLRSGEIKKMEARAVYEGDQFEYEFGLEPKLTHKPCGDSGKLTHVYCVAILADGTPQFDVMTRHQVEEIRDKYSKAKDKDAWAKSFDEMAKKTVVRRIIKMLPVSAEVGEALEAEGGFDFEPEKHEPKKVRQIQEAQMSLTGPEEADAYEEYSKALTEAESLGMDLTHWPVGESVTGQDAMGYAHELRKEIDAWKSKNGSKS